MALIQSAAASTAPWNIQAFANATGGKVTKVGDYIVHTFDTVGTGSFTLNQINRADTTFEILVVAGGGSSGRGSNISGVGNTKGAGGGGGGVIYSSAYTLATGSYEVIVGAGGIVPDILPYPGAEPVSGSGFNSSLGTLVALGGGAGGTGGYTVTGSNFEGANGGSGGGTAPGMLGCPSTPYATGSGLQPGQAGDSGTYGLGNDGALATNCTVSTDPPYNSYWKDGGGGGGAAQPASGTTGGDGLTLNLRGFTETFGKGGDAGTNAGSAAANSGGGGNGDNDGGTSPGNGGSGIVIIRYQYKQS